jgi:hypothetical protein
MLGACALSAVSGAQQLATASEPVQKLITHASTGEDYLTLARYFRTQEKLYRDEAAGRWAAYQQAQKTIAIPKFPAPADNAKWFAQSNEEKANKAAVSAAYYEKQYASISSVGALASADKKSQK